MNAAQEWARLIDKPNNLDEEPCAREIVEAREHEILARDPEDLFEVVIQLELIVESLSGGARTDELDIDAVRRIQRYLRRREGEDEQLSMFLGERLGSRFRHA